MVFAESQDEEQIIERVAALDIGKAEVVCCVRLPAPAGGKRRIQEVSTHSSMVGSLSDLAERLVELRIERVVMEATSDYWRLVVWVSRRVTTSWRRRAELKDPAASTAVRR